MSTCINTIKCKLLQIVKQLQLMKSVRALKSIKVGCFIIIVHYFILSYKLHLYNKYIGIY